MKTPLPTRFLILHILYSANIASLQGHRVPRELSQKYQDLEEDEILRNKTELKTAQMRQWKADRNSLFTEYPAISILKQQNKEDALKSDVLDITCDYIVKELNYDMSSNSKPLPSPIVSPNLFFAQEF